MTGPAYRNGRLLAAGEAPGVSGAIFDGPMHHRDMDKPSGAPERPCARCGKTFTPTLRRAMLCTWCFRSDSATIDDSPHRLHQP